VSRNRSKGNEKRKHHYIPRAYLRKFVNQEGKLRVYLKDHPTATIWSSPDETAFRNYYYSQPTPNGGWDNNGLEAFFEKYETRWDSFVSTLRSGDLKSLDLVYLAEFMIAQVPRVPATRELVQLILEDQVFAKARVLDLLGRLPPKPIGGENILDRVAVSVDPHMSIHAMHSIAEGFSEMLDLLGLCVVRNDTGTPYVTSDNPIIWFDPTLPDEQLRPHSVRRGGPILLFFPIAPDLLIVGTRESHSYFLQYGLYEGQMASVEFVSKINRSMVRFSYQAFYCQTDKHGETLSEFAALLPDRQAR
jgi:hypothetical protein